MLICDRLMTQPSNNHALLLSHVKQRILNTIKNGCGENLVIFPILASTKLITISWFRQFLNFNNFIIFIIWDLTSFPQHRMRQHQRRECCCCWCLTPVKILQCSLWKYFAQFWQEIILQPTCRESLESKSLTSATSSWWWSWWWLVSAALNGNVSLRDLREKISKNVIYEDKF